MSTIHSLNVKEGDCSVIEHYDGNVTVIDVSNGKPTHELDALSEALSGVIARSEKGISGNFRQKNTPSTLSGISSSMRSRASFVTCKLTPTWTTWTESEPFSQNLVP